MVAAQRTHLKREKGWRMPPGTVKVARTSKYGNPFQSKARSAEQFRAWVTGTLTDGDISAAFPQMIANHLISRRAIIPRALPELAGKNLACWCGEQEPCHADILIELCADIWRLDQSA